MVRKKSREELEAAFQRQKGHLTRSCDAFDQGVHEEAERLASVCYILAHDGHGRTKSLLGQLGLKNKIKFIDSSLNLDTTTLPESLQKKLISSFGLPLASIHWRDGKANYKPYLGEGPAEHKAVSFSSWWNGAAYTSPGGKVLSRKNITFSLRTQDGGAHVDEEIRDPAYDELATNADSRISYSADGIHLAFGKAKEGLPLRNAHWATMRQIAWELSKSLDDLGI